MFYNILFIILLIAALICAFGISYTDWRRRIIPDVLLLPLMLIGLIITNFFPWPTSTADGAIAAVFGYALAMIIGVIFDFINKNRKRHDTPIGMGDIKLMVVGGLWLGATGLAMALVIACIAGLIWGIRKQQKFIPFAPFFITGGILSLIATMFLI